MVCRTGTLMDQSLVADPSSFVAEYAHRVELSAKNAPSDKAAAEELTAGLARLRATLEMTRLQISALESAQAALYVSSTREDVLLRGVA